MCIILFTLYLRISEMNAMIMQKTPSDENCSFMFSCSLANFVHDVSITS